MNGRKPMLSYGLHVFGRRISLAGGEMIGWINPIVFHHDGVSCDLGHNRGGRDARDVRVALYNTPFTLVHTHGIAVDEDAFRVDASILDCLRHGRAQRRGHPMRIDVVRRDVRDAYG